MPLFKNGRRKERKIEETGAQGRGRGSNDLATRPQSRSASTNTQDVLVLEIGRRKGTLLVFSPHVIVTWSKIVYTWLPPSRMTSPSPRHKIDSIGCYNLRATTRTATRTKKNESLSRQLPLPICDRVPKSKSRDNCRKSSRTLSGQRGRRLWHHFCCLRRHSPSVRYIPCASHIIRQVTSAPHALLFSS